MANTNNLGYVKLAAALVLSLLMAPSPAVAESEYLNQFLPDKYLRLSYNRPDKYLHLRYNTKELAQQSEGESLSGSETDSAQPEGESQSGSETDSAQPASDSAQPLSDDVSQISTKELSQQSANPVSKYAYVFTQFALVFNDGDANTGEDHLSGQITFQPIIPIPLYGSGVDEWRIVSRPTINLFLGQPIPQGGIDDFDRETGLSDLLLPLPLALTDRLSGRWLLALGPSFSFPTATDEDFGAEQWTAGASGVLGYIADNWMFGMYPQTYFRIADQNRDDDKKHARFGNMFYWFFYNVTDDFQVGTNPTIQWNDKAGRGNKWNVPFGVTLAKITKFGNWPVRIEFAAEYSVIHEDDYGEVARIKFNIIPVVSRPIKKSIFGGGEGE